jgi:hypothetical protein
MGIKPISPDNIVEAKLKTIPDEVIQVFNDLIVRKWNGSSSCIKQDDIITEIQTKLACGLQEIFDNKWLDVEDAYRAEGWVVEYDKPAYNESYAATFEFKKKKNK